jgi:hypothetical protein
MILFAKLAGKYYPSSVAIKITVEMRQLVRKELARAGGKARAKKYDHATLSKWAKLGGRPRKEKAK